MRLLILGGTRFLGKELVNQAVEKGHLVTVISLDPPDHLDKISWINVNRNNTEDLIEKIGDRTFDCVIDNIALAPGQVSKFLSVIKHKTKRYVLTSSIDIYTHDTLRPADEDRDQKLKTDTLDLNTPSGRYIHAKRTLEKELRLDTSSIEKVIVRPTRVVGATDNVRRHGILRGFYYPSKIIDNGPVILYHTDTEMFNLVFVKDVASALLLVAEHPDANNQTYNISGDTVWTSESFLQKMIEVSNSKSKIVRLNQQVLINEGLLTDTTDSWITPYGFSSQIHKVNLFDNSKLKRLGWKPSPDEDMIKSIFENTEEIENLRLLFEDRRKLEIAVGEKYLLNDTDFLPGKSNGVLSSIAIGTHRGENDDETDNEYRLSISESLLNGINVVDTAINYRNSRSEKVVGEVIHNLVKDNSLKRDDVFVITKGGYFNRPNNFPIPNKNEIGKHHSIRSCYVKWSLDESYKNLKLKTIDLFLLHNPEVALSYMSKKEFFIHLTETFTMLEHEVSKGKISSYGIATWMGLLLNPTDAEYINLNEVLYCAKIAAGNQTHHFNAIELPLNVIRHYSFTKKNQTLNNNLSTVLNLAKEKNIKVFTSNSALYGDDSEDIKSRLVFESNLTVPQKNLLVAKSMPEVTSAIVGMRKLENVKSAIEVLNADSLDSDTLNNVIKLCKFKTKE